MDVSHDQIAIVLDSGEIVICNTSRLKLPAKVPDLSFTSTMIQRDSVYQQKPFQVS